MAPEDCPDPRTLRRGARRIALWYAAAGAGWILASNELLARFATDPVWWMRIAILKGWLFIALSAALLYVLIRARVPWAQWRSARSQAGMLDGLALMRAIADGSTDAIFAKDLAGRYVLCNREASRVLGKPVQEVLGRDDTNLFPPSEAAAVMANDRRAIDDACVRTHEEVLSTVDGSAIYLATKGPLRDGTGRIVGMFGISRDITARKRAETALQDSEATQRALLEAMADGMFVAQDRRFVFANAALPRLLQRDPAAFAGLPVEAVVAPEHLETWIGRHEHPLTPDDESCPQDVVALLRPDGSRVWVELRASRLRYEGRPAILGVVRDITERRLAERALREAHELVQAVEDSVLDHMAVLDRDGVIVAVNAAWSRFAAENSADGRPAPRTGVGASYLRASAAAAGPHSEFAAQAHAGVLAVLRRECPHFRLEYPCPSDREPRWFQMSVTPLRTARGGAVVVHADVTARRLAEDALRAGEAQMRKLSLAVEQCPLGIVVTDMAGRIEYVNEAAARLGEGPPDPGTGSPQDGLVPSGVLLERLAAPRRALVAGQPWSGAFDRERRDGATQRLFLRAAPVRQPDGRVTHFLAILEDTTERDRIQAELERHRHHLQQLVAERTAQLQALNEALVERERFGRQIADSQPGLLAYWDPQRRCRFANRAYLEWLGRREDEVVGALYDDIMPPGRVGHNRALVDGALRGEAQRFQRVIDNGRSAPIHAMVTYTPDVVGGEVRGFLAQALDVGEIKQAELQLQRVNAELVVSRDRAEAANRAKSAFVANMSHEIRTPMNAIIGLAHLLRRDTREPVALERLSRLSDAGAHLLQVIDDILDLSKIEAGRLELERIDFSLAEVLDRCRAFVAERAEAKGLTLDIDARGAPDALHGDPTRLSQALLNLMSNAVKFTEAGSVRVRVETVAAAGDGVELRLSVRDTGIGIAADQLAGLFQAFAQADTSTTRRFGGTGLGLAITQRLAAMMGGEVGAASEPGTGSEFWFTARFDCPARPAAPCSPARPSSPSSP